MPGYDLHSHSNRSDGTLGPAEVARGAADRPASRPWGPPPGDLADETARADFVAADLLAQAEMV